MAEQRLGREVEEEQRRDLGRGLYNCNDVRFVRSVCVSEYGALDVRRACDVGEHMSRSRVAPALDTPDFSWSMHTLFFKSHFLQFSLNLL